MSGICKSFHEAVFVVGCGICCSEDISKLVVNPGASLATIDKLEDYLGKRLSPSYEDEFVQTTAARFLRRFEKAAPHLESLITSDAPAGAKLEAA